MESQAFDSTRKFFDAWSKVVEESFGKATNIPAVGPSREKYEKMMTGFSLFINLYSTWMDSVSDVNRLSLEAMSRMKDKIEKIENNGDQDRGKELYNMWMETYSGIFDEFLRSDHFSSDMGKFMSVFIDAQRYNREMLENNLLIPANLPTKTDVDEINAELYHLKKTVRELTHKVRELSEKG